MSFEGRLWAYPRGGLNRSNMDSHWSKHADKAGVTKSQLLK